MNKKIIILGSKSVSTKILYNRLNKLFNIEMVVIEEKESVKQYFSRRFKKHGFIKVFGQILFMSIVLPVLRFTSKKRVVEIHSKYNLDTTPIPLNKTKNIKSVNSEITLSIINKYEPDLILVSGTRIISKKLLSEVSCKFINIHAGITPLYRGVHGAYWALVNNDIENNGVTVHFVDPGIDTGGIIAQKNIAIEDVDNFSTYPLIQLGVGLKLLETIIMDFFNNNLNLISANKNPKSKLWYHPTFFQYLYNRILKGIK